MRSIKSEYTTQKQSLWVESDLFSERWEFDMVVFQNVATF